MARGTKPNGRHPENALSAIRARNISKPGRYADGNGLYLVVDPSGAKRWVLRIVVRGKRRDIGLGGLKIVSLSEAREEARTFRKMAREGGDPIAERRKQRTVIPTFKEAAKTVHAEHSEGWKNTKHKAQWINTLEQYAYPAFGDRRVDQIDTSDVLRALSPIWLAKAETARRVRQRIGTVLDWAKASGFREGENPAQDVTLSKGLPKQPKRKGHHAALPYLEVPGFIADLRQADITESARLAFEFLVLTATRTGELLSAVPDEMDLDGKKWVIPATRMKAEREFSVPLSARCLDILDRAKELPGDYVFPGRTKTKPLSNMTFLMALRRMGIAVTAHGFRSSFRDWAAERTNFSNEVCEMALSHAIEDKTEAAYRRGDLFEKRRDLMNSWSAFTTSAPADIVTLRASGD